MTCSTDPYSHHQRYKFFGKGLGEASPFDTPLPVPSSAEGASYRHPFFRTYGRSPRRPTVGRLIDLP